MTNSARTVSEVDNFVIQIIYSNSNFPPIDGNQSPVQRNTANARERARMRVLSSAFYRLKTIIPWVPHDTKLSKLDTLRLARNYISYLSATLDGQPVDEITNKMPHPQKMVIMKREKKWKLRFDWRRLLPGGACQCLNFEISFFSPSLAFCVPLPSVKSSSSCLNSNQILRAFLSFNFKLLSPPPTPYTTSSRLVCGIENVKKLRIFHPLCSTLDSWM